MKDITAHKASVLEAEEQRSDWRAFIILRYRYMEIKPTRLQRVVQLLLSFAL